MNSAARKNRKSPGGWKPCLLGAAAVAALLASTGCQAGAPKASDDAKPSDEPSAAASAKPDASSPAKTGGGSGDTGGSDDNDGGKGANGGSGTVAACTTDDLAVSATKEPANSKDARHLLITVQNAGDKKCNVYNYPHVMIGDAQRTTSVIEDSNPDPGKPVTIAPGEEAHAALLVAGGGMDEYEATAITLTLHGSKPGSKAGGPVDVPLPVGKLYADDGQLVTYWTTASGFALDFIMSK
ncbi:DUF4232 domain-containing protein [Streptomyces sp. F63]|uniref:DUF4232 domain-containing protein n=1 Tax=Streptomyces sp. F63 TaxID=2824887 RepID=UPI001B36BBA0|nr:DUF4232 domain-containing protein [Streptomyces sp. F63]MBQ0984707.1 DUF4232 domain-containing protein [Streptomyces sp. F63]